MKVASGIETQVRLVYPKPEQEIFEDSTFLMGAVANLSPSALLLFNKQPVPLSSQGFFAFKIPIHAGMNPIKLEVCLAESVPPIAQLLLALYGVPPRSVLPALPLAVHEDTLLPASDVWLSGNDRLIVACSASIDATVSFTIPGLLETPLPLLPLQSKLEYLDTRQTIFAALHWTTQRIPSRGYYQATVSVQDLTNKKMLENLPIKLQLRHEQEILEQILPGTLTILAAPRLATIQEDVAITRTAPEQGARLTPQLKNTRLWIDGLQQGWARARLSQDESFYVPVEALKFDPILPQWQPLALASIQAEAIDSVESKVRLIFAGQPQQACPLQIAAVPSEKMNRLQIRLYGVCSHCDFIHYPANDSVVRQIHWRQVAENVLELWIDLQVSLTGYDYAWVDGAWQFTVKRLPERLADIRVLIDPGHGGTETGSIGLNGLPEKTLNLAVSRLLRDALLKEGFQVSLTRNMDQEVSLPQRGKAVLTENAHIVLSIHHNALPDGRDPLQAKGASCFYYQVFSKPLAAALLAGLSDNRGSRFEVPDYGLFYDSLYMTRIHQAMAVLVEIGFFTHPEEFERLIDPAFQQEAVQRLASALRNYCLSGR